MTHPKHRMHIRQNSGFTLLELSVVLIIIGLVTTIGISAGVSTLETAKRSQTESKLKVIEASLMTFRINNNRLPCPANLTQTSRNIEFGQESEDPGECSSADFGDAGGVVEGAVPTKSLSIPDEFMFDGWGRKIAYAVDSNATEIDAFSAISIPESCGITVNDGAGNPRSTGAIYALVSYGVNGHGGYLKSGSRMTTGAVNTDVLTNCHCNSNARTTVYDPTFVQRDIFEDEENPEQSFTNLVRYKERWQMITEEDQFKFALGGSYRGPNVAAGFAMSASGEDSTYVYKMQCGRLVKEDDLDPAATEVTTGVAFTPDNRYLVSFSEDGCNFYPINGDKVETGNQTAIPGCPAYSTSVQVAMSSNGFLAMISPAPPYIHLWQKSGSSFVPLATPTPAPAVPQSLFAITQNYLMLYDGAALTVYGRTSNSYSALGTQPTSVPASVFSATISPNEHYVAVTVNGVASGTPAPYIRRWRIDTGPTFALLPDVEIVGNDTPYGLTFSSDGKYAAVGGTSGDNIVVYKLEAGDNMNRLSLPTNWTNSTDTPGLSFSFSPDSRYIAMGTADSVKPIAIFQQTSAQQYKLLTIPEDVKPYPVLSIRYNN